MSYNSVVLYWDDGYGQTTVHHIIMHYSYYSTKARLAILGPYLPQPDLARVVPDGQHVALPGEGHGGDPAERGLLRRPVPVDGAARQVG